MSIKKTVRGVAATLTIVGSVTAAAALPANAATPACGPTCLSVFSPALGGTYPQPNFVEHVFGGIASVGTPTGLNTASASDTSEDFINPHPGVVSDYYAMGLVSAAVNQHYGSLSAAQLEYAPAGVPSGLCVGVAADPFENEALSLQSCTVPGRTVWIVGTSLSPASSGAHTFPIVSGATTDFAHPLAMTYPHMVNTNETLPPIRLGHLQFLGDQGTVPENQLWGVKMGTLP
jgi:hypothetical protein